MNRKKRSDRKPDPKCPRCDGQMFRRVQKTTGRPFWGCWNWPHCIGTIDIGQRDYFPIPAWMVMGEIEHDYYGQEREHDGWDDLQAAVED